MFSMVKYDKINIDSDSSDRQKINMATHLTPQSSSPIFDYTIFESLLENGFQTE